MLRPQALHLQIRYKLHGCVTTITYVKQLYACTLESTNFINPQALRGALTALVSYSLGPLKFVDSVVHAIICYIKTLIVQCD